MATCRVLKNRTSAHARVQPGQTNTTSCNIYKCCMKNLTTFKFEPTTPNMSQHVTTWWPNALMMLRPTMLRYVAFKCCNRFAGALACLSSSLMFSGLSHFTVLYMFQKRAIIRIQSLLNRTIPDIQCNRRFFFNCDWLQWARPRLRKGI